MKYARLLFTASFLSLFLLHTQGYSTFSICAIDSTTQEVGSAGASCISGAIILSDVFPGIGIIHTQASYNSSNQSYARSLMEQDKTPEEIVNGVVANDVNNNPATRQYGVVDLVNNGRSAGYSGSGCLDYKNHVIGKNYAIQGNILLGQDILDSMEVGFLNTKGTLADKLMAALQGAKVRGADTRCYDDNKSSISAFIRIAKPNDSENDLYLDLNVNSTSGSNDPIDTLQDLYDNWLATASKQSFSIHHKTFILHQNHPNPFTHVTRISYRLPEHGTVMLKIFSPTGKEIKTLVNSNLAAGQYEIAWDGNDNKGKAVIGGIYLSVFKVNGAMQTCKMLLIR